jgi:hypothetical protein
MAGVDKEVDRRPMAHSRMLMMRFNQYCVKIRSRITWDLTSLSHKLVVIHTLVQFPCGTCLVLFVLITRRQYVTWLYLFHLNAKSSPAQTRRRRRRNHSLPPRTQASGGRRMCSYVRPGGDRLMVGLAANSRRGHQGGHSFSPSTSRSG